MTLAGARWIGDHPDKGVLDLDDILDALRLLTRAGTNSRLSDAARIAALWAERDTRPSHRARLRR